MQPVSSNIDFNHQVYTTKINEQWDGIRKTLEAAIQGTSSGVHDTHDSTVRTVRDSIVKSVSSQQQVTIAPVGIPNGCFDAICHEVGKTHSLARTSLDQTMDGTADILLSPHTLYEQLDTLLSASEALLRKENPLPIEKHPFYGWFQSLRKDGRFVATLTSGPNVFSFTDLLLGKHGLRIEEVNNEELPDLTIFRNAETFIRALDIFKTQLERTTGMTINTEISLTNVHTPLGQFCEEYVARYPELRSLPTADREAFVRLLSIFLVGNDVVDLDITLSMSLAQKMARVRSFEPMKQTHKNIQEGTNEISVGQLDTGRQLQNLNGSEESMKRIKDADGEVQFQAFGPVLGRQQLSVIDLGGGRGETNAVMHALIEQGSRLQLLNVDPDKNAADEYKKYHNAVGVGVDDVKVLIKPLNELTSEDVAQHFKSKKVGEKVDAVYSSHCFYFITLDMLKAAMVEDLPLVQHPLYKYFEMLKEDGVIVVTMQTGTGARQIRNSLLGDHGIMQSSLQQPMAIFGNIGTFWRFFEPFKVRYEQVTSRKIEVKPRLAVANVPFGNFQVEKEAETGGYILKNPRGSDPDPQWAAPTLLDFYGNWDFQMTHATLTPERLAAMDSKKLEKYKLQNVTTDNIESVRNLARKTQSTFLHILRVFAPANAAMLHPNITLEITMK